MNILIITPYIPYPLSEGGKISQFATIDYLKDHCNLTIGLVAQTTADLENIATFKTLVPRVQVEVINLVPGRAPFLLRAFRRVKYEARVFFNKYSANQVSDSQSEFDNDLLNNVPSVKKKGLVNGLVGLVSKENYDLVQVDMIGFIDIVYLLPAHIKKVFVHHEIRFGRLESAVPAGKRTAFENYVFKFVKMWELNYLRQYNAVLVFSEDDKKKLDSEPGLENKVYVSPFPVLEEHFVALERNEHKINKLVFIGGEGHKPNRNAVQWYINEIAPLISANCDIKLHVIGNWGQDTIKQLDKNNIVHFAGYVDDIISYFKDSIMVVPVRTGSGIRTKILYAMAQGVPVISTTIGCEGIKVAHKKSILIADTAAEFAEYVKLLLNDFNTRFNLAASAQLIAKESYSQAAAGGLRHKLFQTIIAENNEG